MEKQLSHEADPLLLRGVIVPVIRIDQNGNPLIYTVLNNGYKKEVCSGELGLLSETYETPNETWKAAFVRCLAEELELNEVKISNIMQNMHVVDRFMHHFSPKKPEPTNGYREEHKYIDYFKNPTGLGDVVVVIDKSADGILPIGEINSTEISSAHYLQPWELFAPENPIRQSYNSRVILSEIAARGILPDSTLTS